METVHFCCISPKRSSKSRKVCLKSKESRSVKELNDRRQADVMLLKTGALAGNI